MSLIVSAGVILLPAVPFDWNRCGLLCLMSSLSVMIPILVPLVLVCLSSFSICSLVYHYFSLSYSLSRTLLWLLISMLWVDELLVSFLSVSPSIGSCWFLISCHSWNSCGYWQRIGRGYAILFPSSELEGIMLSYRSIRGSVLHLSLIIFQTFIT